MRSPRWERHAHDETCADGMILATYRWRPLRPLLRRLSTASATITTTQQHITLTPTITTDATNNEHKTKTNNYITTNNSNNTANPNNNNNINNQQQHRRQQYHHLSTSPINQCYYICRRNTSEMWSRPERKAPKSSPIPSSTSISLSSLARFFLAFGPDTPSRRSRRCNQQNKYKSGGRPGYGGAGLRN